MGDRITFNFNPTISSTPVFVGHGSFIENPDILPIFLGPYWPGSGEMTVNTIVDALNTMASGAYLQGLTQYGYGGSASVRAPRVDQSVTNLLSFAAANPFLSPPINLFTAVNYGVRAYIGGLVDNDEIDNVDDNHHLIMIVFLDPSIPLVPNPSGSNSILGANVPFESFELLDDNIRFETAWIGTSSSQLASVTQTLSHELAEAISDPFNSGWYQQTPPPASGSGQITDVCNQNGLSDGVAVTAYWSNADAACIIPTSGQRSISLSHKTDTLQQPDGPVQQVFVDLGPLCGGGQLFDFVERTYVNNVTIKATIDGFESLMAAWTINGQPFPNGTSGVVTVDATVDVPTAAGVSTRLASTQLVTFNAGPTGAEIGFSTAPGAGNVALRLVLTVRETFDSGLTSRGSTLRTAVLELDLKNQEVMGSREFNHAHANCERVKHLKNTPTPAFGPPKVGDPAGLGERVTDAVRQLRAAEDSLVAAAALAEGSRPELAEALRTLAQRRGSNE